MRSILLTFDVEEFDLPLEYGVPISVNEQMSVGKKGLERLMEVLQDPEVDCTLFATANFAVNFPADILELSKKHEIASHTFFHSSYKPEDLKNSREVLENIISAKVYGLRIPRMKKISPESIKLSGYTYDSSINPTWIPGRYNNLNMPRTFYFEGGIVKVPVSVSANFRIPLFWLAFKNFPYLYFRNIALQTLKKDGYLSLYFHPWEFVDLSKGKLPRMVVRKSGQELLEKLMRLIKDLKNEGEFMTVNNFLKKQ